MEVVENVPFALWSDVAQACGYATYFHTPAWANIVQSSYPSHFRIATRAFQFAHDDWVVLPMMETDYELHGFFHRFSSSALGVYGGLIATKPLDADKVNKITQYLQDIHVKSIDIFGNPYAPPEAKMPGWRLKPNFTQIVPLDQFASEAHLLKAYTHMMRDHIRKATRAGYSCSVATTMEEVETYVDIYQQALDRYGDDATGRQQPQLFYIIFKNAGDNAKLWLAKKDSRIAGGVLAFYHRRHCVAWHAAFRAEDLKSGVAKMLHHRVMIDAKQTNHTIYDFNPSGGHQGTVNFKQMFGAIPKPCTGYHWDNKIYNLYKRVRQLAHVG